MRNGDEPVKAVSGAGLDGKAGHGCADEVRQALGFFGVTVGDVAANDFLCCRLEDAGGFTRLWIIAPGSLQHQAASGGGVGGIVPCGLLQHRRKRFCDRTVRAQEIGKGNRPGQGVAIENTGVETGLVAEGRIEAGWVDTKGFGYLCHADSVVAVGVEQPLSSGNRLVGIETARATASTRSICSYHYKIH